MGLRNLRNRIHDTRSGDTTDPLGQAEADPWIDAITPAVDEDTDPGGADLVSVDPLHEPPPGAIRSVQPLYGKGVRRCGVIGCGVPTTGDVCVKCTENGKTLADLGAAPWDGRSDGYVPPGMERILPDPPPHLPPRSTFATCADPDELSRWAWDDPREQARRRNVVDAIGDHPERVRAYLSVRTHPDPPPLLDGAGFGLAGAAWVDDELGNRSLEHPIYGRVRMQWSERDENGHVHAWQLSNTDDPTCTPVGYSWAAAIAEADAILRYRYRWAHRFDERNPLPVLDGAGYVLEPLPDVADFDEARDQLRAEVLQRIDAEADDRPWFGVCDPGPSVAYVNRLCGIDTDGAAT